MLTFKQLQANQIQIITKMMSDFYLIDNYPFDGLKTEKLVTEFINNDTLGKGYLLYFENQIVGYFILTFVFSFEYQGRIAFLDEFFIVQTARGKGFGNQTLKFIQTLSKTLNFRIVYLEVENHNLLAQKVYLSNHFEFHNRKIMKYRSLN